MRRSGRWRLSFLSAWAVAVLGTASPGAPPPQEETKREKGTRQLWDEAFVESRPRPSRARAPVPGPPRAPAPPGDAFVGVTLWRLRPAGAQDEARGVVVPASDQKWLPERSEVDVPLKEGQRVRLSIEVSRPGYLYVIDRERYADGRLGEPQLVFPTLRLRGGDNAVQAGRVIEVPDLRDSPPCFTLKRSRADHVGETLLLLVTQEPLAGITIGREAQALSRQQVEEWEKAWRVPHRKLETPGGAGRAYTPVEHAAGESATRLLTRDEPLPQTLYRVEGKGGQPVLVSVDLRMMATEQ